MSMRLEMLQVARLAPRLLGDSAGLVAGFLQRQRNDDGGFKDRNGKSDLYYTVFGLDGLSALQIDPDLNRGTEYLRSFGDGEGLDFVHLCCLARCWGAVLRGTPESRLPERSGVGGSSSTATTIPETRLGPMDRGDTAEGQPSRLSARASRPRGIPGRDAPTAGGTPAPLRASSWSGTLERIESYRASDGGYHPVAGSKQGTAYAAFLALGAYQDLNGQLPEPMRLVRSMKLLETGDGAWSNERHLPVGSTNATAAVVTVLRNLSLPIHRSVGDWLLARCHPAGGFLAAPDAPIPDLLSTATALHALAGMQVSFEAVREKCLDFIDTLWTNEGSFHGQWSDDHLDSEYTYYGLLALGHLSL